MKYRQLFDGEEIGNTNIEYCYIFLVGPICYVYTDEDLLIMDNTYYSYEI